MRLTPPLIVWMSFRLAIPWRVALPQSRPRFTSRNRVFGKVVLPVEDFSANGQQCLNCQHGPAARETS